MSSSGRLSPARLAVAGLLAALALAVAAKLLRDALGTKELDTGPAAVVPESRPADTHPPGPTAGDVDNDGDVDLADYVQFAAHYAAQGYSPLISEPLPSGITENTFLNREYLCRPTRDSMTVSLIPAQNVDAYIEYRVVPNGAPQRTDVVYNHPAYEPLEIILTNLEESTRYVYRVRARATGCLNFEGFQEYEFTTRRRPGESFTFAIGADSHVAKLYLCGRRCRDRLALSQKIVEQIANEAVDFFIDLGDTSMTHTRAEDYRAETQDEADDRYSMVRRHWERLSAEVPIFFVLGNHEGETGFEGLGHSSLLTMISTRARLRYIANPPNGINELEDFYAFEWGDALFIVLDPFRYTNVSGRAPDRPEQWTLGTDQLAWLARTMRESDRTWKFIFAHHLVGGAYEASAPYRAYGGGGAEYADAGEQARVQELMERYGGHFFYGHNHVFAHGVNDGVNYILTSSYGAAYGGILHSRRVHLFEHENVIAEQGHTKVHVTPEEFTFWYIRGSNGDVLYEHTVYAR